jgi:hypothetical protein
VPKKKSAQPDTEEALVRISASLRDRAKAQGAKDRRTLQAVLEEAIEEYLKKRGA